MTRFPCEKFASLELNQVSFPKTGAVVSQVPLGSAFTEQAPCENGMWVVADKAYGTINAPSATIAAPIGIVYTAEKEYDDNHYGLKTFGRKIAGDYPRVGILSVNDTVTTNCLQYDETTDFPAVTTTGSEKTSEEVLFEALEAATVPASAAPLYVVPVTGSAIPKIAKSIPASGIYAKIVKFYTVPNGERGVKYQIIRV
jgi:hypothetical protein